MIFRISILAKLFLAKTFSKLGTDSYLNLHVEYVNAHVCQLYRIEIFLEEYIYPSLLAYYWNDFWLNSGFSIKLNWYVFKQREMPSNTELEHPRKKNLNYVRKADIIFSTFISVQNHWLLIWTENMFPDIIKFITHLEILYLSLFINYYSCLSLCDQYNIYNPQG